MPISFQSGHKKPVSSSSSIFLSILDRVASSSDQTANTSYKPPYRQASKIRMRPDGIVRKHRPDYFIILFMSVLMLIGLVLIYAISPQRVNALNNAVGYEKYQQNYFFIKQLVALGLCLVAFAIAGQFKIMYLKKHIKLILTAGFVLAGFLWIGGVLKMPWAVCTYGACRWLNLGPLGGTLQVSEVLKFCLLIFFGFFWAYFMHKNQINSKSNLFYSAAIAVAAVTVVVVFQNDLGTGMSLIGILLAMVWAAGLNSKYILLLTGILLVGIIGMVIVKPHRLERVTTFLKGDNSQMTDDTRHIIESKIALGSGGLFGLGIGKSIQSTGYLPEAINDSIFAIIGEVFGFVGALIILALFAALLYRLLKGVAYSHNDFNRLIFAGVFGWVFAHVFINIGSMIGLIPMTGITLPFLSFGGTSMLFISAALGLAFNMSQYTAHNLVEERVQNG